MHEHDVVYSNSRQRWGRTQATSKARGHAHLWW
uniref:Uncharacterized protein n=1 Tax=Arundo donax TaxID=35708 RepID=A0A0A9C1N5_ARUDO